MDKLDVWGVNITKCLEGVKIYLEDRGLTEHAALTDFFTFQVSIKESSKMWTTMGKNLFQISIQK